jgi:hypothetical protein
MQPDQGPCCRAYANVSDACQHRSKREFLPSGAIDGRHLAGLSSRTLAGRETLSAKHAQT